ncbi:MAG TPA: type II toxin-antitoxin system RelE/ParE family toxin [bacterium]|nr:type II toxin-antitoxin system RelE/ParE family toxin [bacterium]
MADVRWTAQALDDLDSVCAYIARDSPHYAQMFATDVFEAAEQLARFPRLGRIVPEVARDTVRELIVGNYRLIYRVQQDQVEILTIHHGARRLERDRV